MKQDEWIKQLHDKLADHEVAAPEGLWDNIEAAIEHKPTPVKPHAKTWRKWAAAAAITLLVSTGAYWQLNQSSRDTLVSTSHEVQDEPTDDNKRDDIDLGTGTPIIANNLPTRLSAKKTPSRRTDETQSLPIVQVPADSPPAEEQPSYTPEDTPPTHQAVEKPSDRQTVDKAQNRQTADKPSNIMPADKPSERPAPITIALYASNGLTAYNSSNEVMMAQSLARNYDDVYAASQEALSRGPSTIYLAGYEERQHHRQPVSFGLTAGFPVGRRLTLTTGIVYTKLSSTFSQAIHSQLIEREQTLHYIGIPLTMNYTLWQHHGFKAYVNASGQADWNTSAHTESEGVEQQLDRDKMQWSVRGSLGIQYSIVPQVGLYAEPGMSYYFDNGSHVQNFFKEKPLNFSLHVGLRLNLK